jgi:hypothetical protein
MDYVHFINLEYFILLAYRVFTGTNIDISQIPAQTLQLTEWVAWAGIVLTVVFAWLFFSARRSMHAVEHEGWHKRHEEEEHLKVRHTEEAPINSQWEHIQTLMSSQSEGEWRRAIMEADIMMGGMLTARGFRGNTIADQLRDANPIQFTTLDLAWKAHKVRNEIAHQGESFTLDERTAQATINLYRRVFEEFQYL